VAQQALAQEIANRRLKNSRPKNRRLREVPSRSQILPRMVSRIMPKTANWLSSDVATTHMIPPSTNAPI
jgi:hypothetical protein